MTNDYLITEKPFRALAWFSFPMIVGNIFQQFYTMVDSVIVGRFINERALAAVGASYALTNIFICIAIGGGVGASVVVSKHFGAKDYTKMKSAVSTALIAFLLMSIGLSLFGLLLNRKIMILLNTPSDTLSMAMIYLKIYFWGLPFLFMYNVISAIFNALGKSSIPLFFLIFSSVLNIILDLFMVTVLHLGVAGVSLATLISQGVATLISFFVLVRILKRFPSETVQLFSEREFSRMFKIALPSILQQSVVSIGMMLVQSVVNAFGSSVLAGFSAAMRIESICVVPMIAIGNAVSSFTAQNLGANKEERVVKGYKASNLMVFFFGLVICFILELFNTSIIGVFLGSHGTAEALKVGENYLSFMGWFYCIIGIKMAVDGLLRGAGDMKMFTIANLANLFVRVTVSVLLAPVFGISMVWVSVPFAWFLNFLISFYQYKTGHWKVLNQLTH